MQHILRLTALVFSMRHIYVSSSALELLLGEDNFIVGGSQFRNFHCNGSGPYDNGNCMCQLILQGDSNFVMNGGPLWKSGRAINNDECYPQGDVFLYMQADGNLVTYGGPENEVCWATNTFGPIGQPYALYVGKPSGVVEPSDCELRTLRQIWTSKDGGLDANSPSSNLDRVLREGISDSRGPNLLYNENGCSVRFRDDGELVVKKEGSTIWRSGEKRSQAKNPELILQSDGNLVVYEGDQNARTALWASDTVFGSGKYNLYIDENCNLSIFDEVWANLRFDMFRFDQLERGGKFIDSIFTLTLQEDGNLVQTDENDNVVWDAKVKSEQDNFFLSLQGDGNMVLYEVINDAGEVKPYWSMYAFSTGMTSQDYIVTMGPFGPSGANP